MDIIYSLPTNRQPSLKVDVLLKAQRAASRLFTTYPLPFMSGGCLVINDPSATGATSLSCFDTVKLCLTLAKLPKDSSPSNQQLVKTTVTVALVCLLLENIQLVIQQNIYQSQIDAIKYSTHCNIKMYYNMGQ